MDLGGEMVEQKKDNVCIDLDGVLAQYDEWTVVQEIGNPIKGAQAFVEKLSEKYRIVIHTSRCNVAFNKGYNKGFLVNNIVKWLEKHKFKYDEVYCGEGKAVATAYIDDRAIQCKPQQNKDAFQEVLKELTPKTAKPKKEVELK